MIPFENHTGEPPVLRFETLAFMSPSKGIRHVEESSISNR